MTKRVDRLPANDDGWVSQHGLAKILGIQYNTLRVYRARGDGNIPDPDFLLDNKPIWDLGNLLPPPD